VKTLYKASKHGSICVFGDFHLFASQSFEDLCAHPKVINWLHAYEYPLIAQVTHPVSVSPPWIATPKVLIALP
jgi:hypothetical protein